MARQNSGRPGSRTPDGLRAWKARAAALLWLMAASEQERGLSCFAIRIKRREASASGSNKKRNDFNKFSEESFSRWDQQHQQGMHTKQKDNSSGYFSELIHESVDSMIDTVYSSVNRPMKDVWDGLWTAASLSWNGYAEGVRGMTLDYPFRRSGFWNALAGSSAGVIHFALCTTSGVAAAGYQIARGVIRTMEAIRSTAEGKIWNTLTSDWEWYSLDEDITRISSTESAQSPSSSSSQTKPRRLRKRVRDKTYYDLLDVPVDATTAQIKKAYYRQALQVHPDKATSSESAAHFQELSNVYQTLVSGPKRELYDQHGLCFAQELPDNNAHVDPYIFFAILFDSAVVEPYTGILAIPTIVDNVLQLTERAEKSAGHIDYDHSAHQQRRQVNVASHLRERIQYMNGKDDIETFRNEAKSLSLAISSPIHAGFLLRAIGSALMSGTSKYFALSWSSQVTKWVQGSVKGAKASTTSWKLESIIRQAVSESDYVAMNNASSDNECNAEESSDRPNKGVEVEALLLKLSTPKVMRLVWDFNVNDIFQTIHRACSRVVDDCGQDLELRQQRANALYSLGREFWTVASSERFRKPKTQDPNKIHQNVQNALQNSIKSEGEDDHDDGD